MSNSNQTHASTNCDQQRIINFLQSDDYRIEDEELVVHLDSCPDCRVRMESLAADAKSWKQAELLLKPDKFDQASSALFSAAGTVTQSGHYPEMLQAALDFLTPSEDPHRLGRLGNYEITGVIGHGGMGIVFKAIDPTLDRVVAIKLMAPGLANNEAARKRFAREAKAAAAVLHPNVIPIHSVYSESRIPYLVMAYNRGCPLQKRLEKESPLQLEEILRIGSQIAAGLAAAHEQGLVHRDIKPENILLEEGVERVAITDFGLARAVDDNSITQHGGIAGTPMYMSPEQARGEQVDQKSDLFSMGSVIYALCTGRPPYRAETSYGVMRKIIDESPIPICQLNPEIPLWLARIVEKLMAKNKADRFASAGEVHKLLEACLCHVQQPTLISLPDIPGQVSPQLLKPFLKTGKGILAMISFFSSIVLLSALCFLQERPSLTITGPATSEIKNNPTATPYLIVESHKGDGSQESGKTSKHLWKMKGQSVGSMKIRLLHIVDGKAHVVSESFYKGGTDGEQAIEVELQLESVDQPMPAPGLSNALIPGLAVSVNGLQSKSKSEEKIVLSGGESGAHGITTNGDLTPGHILMYAAISDKGVEYDHSLVSMLMASQKGASFLVTVVDWKSVEEAKINAPEDDQADPVIQSLEREVGFMRKALANPQDFPAVQKMTKEQLESAHQELKKREEQLLKLKKFMNYPQRKNDTVANKNNDETNIQGTWQVTYSEDSGRVAPQESLKDIKFIFEEGGMIMHMGNMKQEITYLLDSSTSPKSIDWIEKAKTKKGIYDLQGDTLRICFAEQSKARPTAFDSKPDSPNDIVIQMKRVKPGHVGLPDESYSGDQLDVKKAVLNKNGKLEINYSTLIESMYYCPGANSKMTEQGLELVFVRSLYNKREKVDHPVDSFKQIGGTITVDPQNKPVYVRSGDKLQKIWDPKGNQGDGKTSQNQQNLQPDNQSQMDDVKHLFGEWQAIYVERAGVASVPKEVKKINIKFQEDMTLHNSVLEQTFEFSIDKSTNPVSINIKDENGAEIRGILDLRGDTLRICNTEKSQERPTSFDTTPEKNGTTFLILKRVLPVEYNAFEFAGDIEKNFYRRLETSSGNIPNDDLSVEQAHQYVEDNLDTQLMSVKTLSAEVAAELSKLQKDLWLPDLENIEATALNKLVQKNTGHLYLEGITTLPEGIANEFGKARCAVSLAGVKWISEEDAKQLAMSKHPLKLGLEELEIEIARHLAAHQGWLILSNLKKLNEEQAKALAPHPGRLSLNALTTISPEVAEALGNYQGEGLDFNELATLDVQTAKHLANTKCKKYLRLDGLKTITPEVLQVLANGNSSISLQGIVVRDISTRRALDNAAVNLRKSGKELIWGEVVTEEVVRLGDSENPGQ